MFKLFYVYNYINPLKLNDINLGLCDILKVGHVAIFGSFYSPEIKPIWPIATNWEGELLTTEEIFKETVTLKEIFPKKKIILKVTNQQGLFNNMIAERNTGAMVRVKSLLHKYVQKYGFDGVDFELQRFPVVKEFVLFLKFVRQQMRKKMVSFTGSG